MPSIYTASLKWIPPPPKKSRGKLNKKGRGMSPKFLEYVKTEGTSFWTNWESSKMALPSTDVMKCHHNIRRKLVSVLSWLDTLPHQICFHLRFLYYQKGPKILTMNSHTITVWCTSRALYRSIFHQCLCYRSKLYISLLCSLKQISCFQCGFIWFRISIQWDMI